MVRQLLLKVLLLVSIVTLLVELTIRFSPFRQKDLATDFAAAIIDKQEILRTTPSPKVVVIGGSSVAYGIDTQLMSDSLQMPVINMSFQYFLGSDFLFQQILESLNEGDKVIASFEYIVTKEGDKKEQRRAAYYYPAATEWIRFDSQTTFNRADFSTMSGDDVFGFESLSSRISSFVLLRIDFIRKIILRLYDRTPYNPTVADKKSTFFREAINEHGDLISHLNNDLVAFDLCNTAKDSAFFPVIENVSQYTKLLGQRGIQVFYTFPPYEAASFANDKPLIDSVMIQFRKYPNITLLNSPYDTEYPNHYFHDMCYHLNALGRRERTLQLIQDFKNVAR